MTFGVGDFVVAPGCGLGVVEDIEKMEMGDETVSMYKIHLNANDTTVWVPTWRAATDGFRPPMNEAQVAMAFDLMASTEAPAKRANWNRRQRRYNEALMSNDPLQMAALLGELASVRRVKTLSFGERRLYDRVRQMFEDELAAATDDAAEVVGARLDEVLHLPEAAAA